MPAETVTVISAIVAMFAVFAVALAWTDIHAHGYPKKPAE